MQKSFGTIFGGLIAYVLLGLYTFTLLHIILEVLNCTPEICETKTFPAGLIYVVTTIGGLVSALVISKLTVTDPEGGLAIVSERKIHWRTFF